MRIRPIVEGHGEVPSVPLLLRRLLNESGAAGIEIRSPLRGHVSALRDESGIRRFIHLALLQGCEGILILFDSDRSCPRTEAPRVQAWAQAEAREIPCEVVLAHCEYEAWFLGALESLRGYQGIRADAVPPADPESMRDAKARLTACMEPGKSYKETTLQAKLTARFDLSAAHRNCRSFRRMVRAVGLVAGRAGVELADWPPVSWRP